MVAAALVCTLCTLPLLIRHLSVILTSSFGCIFQVYAWANAHILDFVTVAQKLSLGMPKYIESIWLYKKVYYLVIVIFSNYWQLDINTIWLINYVLKVVSNISVSNTRCFWLKQFPEKLFNIKFRLSANIQQHV